MKFLDNILNPLEFWRNNQDKYPILSQIARFYMGIPASSA